MKPILLTRHALQRMSKRDIDFATVERAVRTPSWVEPDPRGSERERRYYVNDGQGHALRVVCVEIAKGIRVITITPDRNARAPT